jgi:hypothetical protein
MEDHAILDRTFRANPHCWHSVRTHLDVVDPARLSRERCPVDAIPFDRCIRCKRSVASSAFPMFPIGQTLRARHGQNLLRATSIAASDIAVLNKLATAKVRTTPEAELLFSPGAWLPTRPVVRLLYADRSDPSGDENVTASDRIARGVTPNSRRKREVLGEAVHYVVANPTEGVIREPLAIETRRAIGL